MAYDPYQHADQLGLTVHYGNPGTGLLGLYIHRSRAIMLRAGLSARVERCALAHEIVHAEYDDEPTSDGTWSAKREARCDRIAAERLIDRETLLSTASAYEDMGGVGGCSGGYWVDSRRLSGCSPVAAEVRAHDSAEPLTGRRPILLVTPLVHHRVK